MEELKVKFLMGPPDCNDPHIPEYSENYLKELGKVLGMPIVCREIEEVKNQALSVYFTQTSHLNKCICTLKIQ